MPTPPSEAWREHTAERWLRDDPEGYARCIELIKGGETNKSRLADLFCRSRNTIAALMVREFSVEQLKDITAKRAIILASDAMDRQDELVPHAGRKELGALSMVAKSAFDVAQLASGGPTEVHEHRHVHLTVDDLNAFLHGEQPAPAIRDATPLETGSGAGGNLALPRAGARARVDLAGRAGAGADGDTADCMSAVMVTVSPVSEAELADCHRGSHDQAGPGAGNFEAGEGGSREPDRGAGGVAGAGAPRVGR
jgi:hypothetical protein